ncbi:WD domain, G-beta repeat protein (macronuclear) [Tetrahymena thermophila SB210]|uniref:WD domain, G-beta repeat protein n=1 Tax=Tetrahymena thermophila (strain SB210) TaxID=312017 RepID=W7XD23_TETTS|nr:WD domain, G-beta repeat protein [Tetrahymena thermophila SB210]EWS71711.1 WD domain, G-beta repeat protein [Tetrahymena thermophila SB210]|eukprot:XP_012655752.1 WD domain, G-beta repeat protein [Tetrahymena thermophila SB210]
MTITSSCAKVSEDDIQQEIGEILVYSSSIFFILTNDELLVFQLNILPLQMQREEIPRVDLLQIQKIQENLMMIRFSSEGFLVSLEPTGLIKIYQILIDQESIESEKVLNYLNQYDFKFQAPMFLTNIIINVKQQMISLFGKQILSVNFDFYKNSQINNQQTQKNIPKIQNGHTDKINGMLIDELQKRIISYSDDGSFKVWELNEDSYNQTFAKQMSYDSNFDNVNFIMEQYHPSCNPYNLLVCKFKVLGMDIFKDSGYLLSQYNDNTVVMWQYSIFQITYIRTFSLKDQTKKLNNFHIDKFYLYITISNNQEVKVFHLLNQNQTYSLPYDNPLKTYILRNDYNFYLVILKQTPTIISALFYSIRGQNLEKINFYIEFQGQMQSIHVTEQDESTSYANLYSFFISTNQNKLFFIDYNFNKFTTVVPVATALAFFTDLDILICFSKSFQTYLVDASSTNILNQFQYFNSIISENAITIPFRQKICFVYINNANDAIKNQVIGINHQGAIIYLATFEQKITSVKADHITQKIFIGFQNGQIYYGSFSPQLKINSYRTTYTQDLRYSKIIRGFISFQSNLMIYDLISMESSIFPKKHLNDISGYILDENNNSIITYSNETNTNLFKWDINALEYYQIKNPIQIKGGTMAGVDQVFLDLYNGFLITFNQAILEIIVWTYPNLKFQFKGTVLQEAKQNLTNNNDSNENGSQQPQYTYAVKQFYLFKQNMTLLILDNQDSIIAYNYQNNISYIFTENSSDKFFFDEEVGYLFIKKGFGLQSVLKVYNISLSEIAEKRDHNLDIRNVIFKRKYTYSYDINIIAVIDKVSLQTIRTIKCLNPTILNIIISEKLDMIFIWNDYYKDKVFYQKIAIFNISSGLFYKEVSANQQLEYGNIGAVTLDESSYTLFFSRSNFCIFAFDLLRFVYTGYYIIKFNTAITTLTFLPQYNSLLCSDSAQIMFFNVENALNSRNLVTPLYQSRNDNYFIHNQQQKTYFIDYDNSLWVLDNQSFELNFLKQLQTIMAAKFWNENIYLSTTNALIKLDMQLNVLHQLDIQLRTLYFSQKSIFCQNQNYDLVKIDIDSLTLDSKFKIAFQLLENNVMDIYSAIKQDIRAIKDPNQDIDTSFDFIEAYCAYKAIYDPQTNKLYTLSNNGLIIVYGFSFTKKGTINSITLQNWLPLPTLLNDVKLNLQDQFFLIEMPWQLSTISKITNYKTQKNLQKLQMLKYLKHISMVNQDQVCIMILSLPIQNHNILLLAQLKIIMGNMFFRFWMIFFRQKVFLRLISKTIYLISANQITSNLTIKQKKQFQAKQILKMMLKIF